MIRDLMRDESKTFPTDPDAARVSSLRVWHCKYASLTPVGKQYRNLETLLVASYPNLDLEPIGSLSSLKYLSVLHMPAVTDLEPLGRLTNLRTLRLSTLPSWDSSGKVTEVDSLRPLALLPNLRHLELFGVRPASKSLRELEEAQGLVSVRVSKYPNTEVMRYYENAGVSDGFAPSPGIADWT